tara:strand:- start:231 stop:383 length:153 start_codon:yes stop_codon:yes gene_type:complete
VALVGEGMENNARAAVPSSAQLSAINSAQIHYQEIVVSDLLPPFITASLE